MRVRLLTSYLRKIAVSLLPFQGRSPCSSHGVGTFSFCPSLLLHLLAFCLAEGDRRRAEEGEPRGEEDFFKKKNFRCLEVVFLHFFFLLLNSTLALPPRHEHDGPAGDAEEAQVAAVVLRRELQENDGRRR